MLGLKSQLREINDIGNRRLNKLNQVDKQAYDAVQWLNNNRDKFRGRVYEPIMLQVCATLTCLFRCVDQFVVRAIFAVLQQLKPLLP